MERNETKALFNSAKNAAKSSDGEKLPAGRYKAILGNVEHFVAKSTGKNFVKFDYTIHEPEQFQGAVSTFVYAVNNEVGLKICLVELRKLGVDVDMIEDFESLANICDQVAEAKIAVEVEFTAVDQAGYQKAYIKEVYGSTSGQQAEVQKEVQAPAETHAPVQGVQAPAPTQASSQEVEIVEEVQQEASTEEITPEVGGTVEFMYNGEKKKAKIKAIDFEEGVLDVQLGLKVVKVKGEEMLGYTAP
jgi:hypothetical protein